MFTVIPCAPTAKAVIKTQHAMLLRRHGIA